MSRLNNDSQVSGHMTLLLSYCHSLSYFSASVLDRLNALMEPHGVLSINERGVIDGQIPTIEPHSNFRYILFINPMYTNGFFLLL